MQAFKLGDKYSISPYQKVKKQYKNCQYIWHGAEGWTPTQKQD